MRSHTVRIFCGYRNFFKCRFPKNMNNRKIAPSKNPLQKQIISSVGYRIGRSIDKDHPLGAGTCFVFILWWRKV